MGYNCLVDLTLAGDLSMEKDSGWVDSTYISMVEDDTIFGPDGVYGWFMNLWYRFWA